MPTVTVLLLPAVGTGVALTVTVKGVEAFNPPISLTVIVKLAVDELHGVSIVADTTPVGLIARFDNVTLFTVAVAPPLTVTAKVFFACSASLIFPMVEVELGEPVARVTFTALIVGAVFTTVTSKEASVVSPQLSVARIVRVWVPAGAAFVSEITPLELSTPIPPV